MSVCYYVFDGKQFTSQEELMAAMNAKFGADSAAGAAPSASAVNVRGFLAAPDQGNDRVRLLFRQFAGPDGRLRHGQMIGLATSIAAELNIDPRQFGDLNHLFYRFDFTGDNCLDETEGVAFVASMLRHYRDSLEPPKAGQPNLLQLDFKQLDMFYILGKQIGQGGQGAVYLAKEKATGQDRVVKFFSKSDANAPLDDIKDEFKLLGKLDHPKIQRLYEIFEDRTNCYLASEPYSGGDLTKLVENAQQAGVAITNVWLGRVVHQTLEGVGYLHSKMIMHCDLKEPNVMIARTGMWDNPPVVVIDFGLANNFASGNVNAGGTPGYMPPEVWTQGLWTSKGDVHCLGVILYQLFAGGQRVFNGHDIPSLTYATVNTLPDMNAIAWCQNLPQLVEQMLAKDFRQRPSVSACLAHPFFDIVKAGVGSEPIPNEVVDSLSRLGEKDEISKAILTDIAAKENLQDLQDLNRLFADMDANNDGVVTAEEARVKLSGKFDAATVQNIVTAMAGDGGKLEYTKFMGQMLCAKLASENQLLWREFSAIDVSMDGVLDAGEISVLLQRPALAALLRGKDAGSIMQLMDKDGDGRITFEEFCMAMRGGKKLAASEQRAATTYVVGQDVQYNSPSLGGWIPCKCIAVDADSGAIQLDSKAGFWFTRKDQAAKIRAPPSTTYVVGQDLQYNSPSLGGWIPCKCIAVDATSGAIQLDSKAGFWFTREDQAAKVRAPP